MPQLTLTLWLPSLFMILLMLWVVSSFLKSS